MTRRARMPTPKIRVYHNGKATLSGVTASDLASILTAASLQRYDNPAKAEPEPSQGDGLDDIRLRNWQDEVAWHKRQRWIIDRLLSSLHGTDQPRRLTVSERWSEVRFVRGIRVRIAELFEERENAPQSQ